MNSDYFKQEYPESIKQAYERISNTIVWGKHAIDRRNVDWNKIYQKFAAKEYEKLGF